MQKLWIDNETRSRIDLKKFGAYRYAECPDFRVLMCAWSIDKINVHLAIGHEEVMAIPGLFDPKVKKIAWNAQFERVTMSALKGLPVGKYLPPRTYDDPSIRASENGYPGKLEEAAKALGTAQKDSAGTRLINLFCKPNRKGEFNDATTHPEQWKEFCDYCIQDVVTLIELDDALPEWPPGEYDRWLASEVINDIGMPLDVEMATIAEQVGRVNGDIAKAEAIRISGIANPNAPLQMKAWLGEQGFPVPNMTADTVEATLEREDLTPVVRQVLELRQEMALVAAKKYSAALGRANSDGRMRGCFKFFGAHTGRWSGRGAQPQNMPNASLGDKDMSFQQVEDLIAGSVLDLHLGNGASPQELKALVRAMFIGPFTVVDYAAIEARVIAWLANEQWALDAFALGRDIYVETAERMGGLTRKEGKVAVLALGYQGGINSLKIMGAQGDNAHLTFLRDQWREANPRIVKLWYQVEEAFWYGDRPAGPRIFIEKHGRDRHIRLPSGRALVYHGVGQGKIKMTKPDGTIEYKDSIVFDDPKGYKTGTYGGRLTENITQAVARDIMAEALVKLVRSGYEVVGHVHDEVIVKGGTIEGVKGMMVDSPKWAAGLPISAEGFQCERYRKD